MKAGLTEREPGFLARWQAQNLYEAIQDARREDPLFVLHDGPPFANGDVHMGTALNKLLKDFVVKSRTMLGHRAPFVPGWDCHGLPIEFKVVKETRGLTPAEIRRRSAEMARKFIDIQRETFKRLGVFGDWDNPYLTLDPAYEADIIRVFGRFVAADLVYRSSKPVHWSTGAQTALAEAEIEYADHTSPSVYVEFPLAEAPKKFLSKDIKVVIWTTTPWTLPANLAIAVQPRSSYVVQKFVPADPQDVAVEQSTRAAGGVYLIAADLVEAFSAATGLKAKGKSTATLLGTELEGWKASHPFLDRVVPLLPADYVTMTSGTGCVHTAPGHGAEDYTTGVRYGLPILSPVDERGCFTEECGVVEWVGRYVFDANPAVIDLLREKGRLVAHQPYNHSYPHCWRSKTPVIFRAVDQFFIRIDKIRPAALEGIEATEWLPAWGRNRIRETVASRPDWCISRQRTWGVPLPVFFDASGVPLLDPGLIDQIAKAVEVEGAGFWFEATDEALAVKFGLPAGTTRRLDTLDVWIDSGVSHQAVLRRNPALQFPADLYLEATDQHRGWFQSSLMTSVAIEGVAPYRAVLTHGFVTDTDGNKLAKSKQGGYSKPTDARHFIESFGADMVRLWAASVDHTEEVPFSEDVFKQLSEAYRRMRNTLRILLANLHDFDPATQSVAKSDWPLVDRWIAHRMDEVTEICREAYAAYEFRKVFQELNNFCTVDLSSLYIDITKDRLYCDKADSTRRRATQTAMAGVFKDLTRLLAPILAFTAEEAWGFLDTGSIHTSLFPEANSAHRDPTAAAKVDELLRLRAVIGPAIEQARQAKKIGKAIEAVVNLTLPDAELRNWIGAHLGEVEEFLILSRLEVSAGDELAAVAVPSPDKRCERCWRHLPDVGSNNAHPDLCERCATALA